MARRRRPPPARSAPAAAAYAACRLQREVAGRRGVRAAAWPLLLASRLWIASVGAGPGALQRLGRGQVKEVWPRRAAVSARRPPGEVGQAVEPWPVPASAAQRTAAEAAAVVRRAAAPRLAAAAMTVGPVWRALPVAPTVCSFRWAGSIAAVVAALPTRQDWPGRQAVAVVSGAVANAARHPAPADDYRRRAVDPCSPPTPVHHARSVPPGE